MIITRDFIFENRTDNGAWTYAQLAALGVSCPPTHGWIDEIMGSEISEENARLFIEGKNKLKKKNSPSSYVQINRCALEELKRKAKLFDEIQMILNPKN